ncbi:MAG: hypothetical protein R2745_16750 [Vicinamibacterales bacterium]
MLLLWMMLSQAPQAVDATALEVTAPTAVAQIDGGKWKGEARQLAWSPDRKEIYLQFVETRRNGQTVTHAVATVATGAMKKVDGPPAWANAYWTWKSGRGAPAKPTFQIAVDQRTEAVTSTATPMGGDLARGGADPGASGISVEEVAGAHNQRQAVQIFELRLKGESLGTWKNEAVVPGTTFGWAPAATGVAIAYVNAKGDLMLMDERGEKRQVDGVADASLPAWSDDGSQIAMLVRTGRRTQSLSVVSVSTP